MGIIVKEIKIDEDSYSFISNDGEKGNILKNLSKINIFVGENNSGKSRFLRSIFADKKLEFIPNNKDFNQINNYITALKEDIKTFYSHRNFNDINDLNKQLEEIKPIYYISSNLEPLETIKNFIESVNNIIKDREITLYHENSAVTTYTEDYDEDIKELIEIVNRNSELHFNKHVNDINLIYGFKRLYIPILRGLRTLNLGIDTKSFKYGEIKRYSPPANVDSDLYEFRTILDYFASEVEKDPSFKDNIFTGLNIYEEIRKHKLSLDEDKQILIEDFEDYLSETFFMNEKVKLTPAENEGGIKSDVIMVKIGNERGKPIYELGDGIQSIIIITLRLFLMRDLIKENENLLIFIEEPEHFLHPSLQRKLIETFNDKRFDRFQFFFTTHSNHFLDLSLDFEGISMFIVDKYLDATNNPKFLIKNVDFGDNNILKLLGIRSSSVFLPNCNIWVEGITDVLYLRRFFNIYQHHMKNNDMSFKKFDEDRHYSFYVYNGSDITHLLELSLNENDRRLNRLLVIRDGDTEREEDKKEHNNKLSSKLGDNFELLDCWEMENLLLPSVIYKTLENDKRYRNITLNKAFEEKDYQNEDLKEFIKVNVCGNQINWNPVGKKKKFYNRVEQNIVDYNHISKDALKLCEKIYNFIKENNS